MTTAGTDFGSVAATFCRALEDPASHPRDLARELASLVAAALSLPTTNAVSTRAADDSKDIEDGCRVVVENLRAMLAGQDLYWDVFDPSAPGEPVAGSLEDDLVDIYRDLRRGLDLAEAGSEADATWEWRFSFETHWGRHASDALRVLVRLIVH